MKFFLGGILLLLSNVVYASGLNCHAVSTLAEQSMRYQVQANVKNEAQMIQTIQQFFISHLSFARHLLMDAQQQRVARSLNEQQRITQYFIQKWHQKCLNENSRT